MSIWQGAGQHNHSRVGRDFTQVLLPHIILRSIRVAILNTELVEARKKWGPYMRVFVLEDDYGLRSYVLVHKLNSMHEENRTRQSLCCN
jgi:hypothetical protein